MSTLLRDDDTLIARGPLMLAVRWATKAHQFAVTYNAAHAQLVSDGWLFAEPFGTSYASDSNMDTAGYFLRSGEVNAWSGFAQHLWWFPVWQHDAQDHPWLKLVREASEYPFPVFGHIQEKWENLHTEPLWQAIVYNQFLLGFTQRVSVRYAQHRIAKVLENCYCMDNRGRPREE